MVTKETVEATPSNTTTTTEVRTESSWLLDNLLGIIIGLVAIAALIWLFQYMNNDAGTDSSTTIQTPAGTP